MPEPKDILTGYSKKILEGIGYKPGVAKPATIPPPEQPEFFPGFGKELQQLSLSQFKAQQRLAEAERAKAKMEQLGIQHPLSGIPLLTKPPAGFMAPATGGLISTEDYNRELKAAQLEFDLALQDVKSLRWRQEVMSTLPNYLSMPTYKIQSANDILNYVPLDSMKDEDTIWLNSTYERLKHLSNILPDDYNGDAIEAQSKILNEILTQPKLELKAVHNLTVDEIAKSFVFGVAQLPQGMTEEDVRKLLGKMELDKEEMKSAQDWLSGRASAWALETDRLNLIRSGMVLVDAPALTPIEFGKLLLTQPMMATAELLDKYFNLLPRPLASVAIIGVHNLFKTPEDTAAARLEEQYNYFRSMGESSWESYAKAFNNWDVSWVMKMGIEIAFDPTIFIGFGLATSAANKLGYGLTKIGLRGIGTRIGPWVGAFESGYVAGADAIFKAGVQVVLSPIKGAFWLTGAGYTIPRTVTGMARNFARSSIMDFKAVLDRTFPDVRNLKGLTVKDLTTTAENLIKQAIERPMEGHDLAVRAGANLLEFGYLDDVAARGLVRDVVAKTTVRKFISGISELAPEVARVVEERVATFAKQISRESGIVQSILREFQEDFSNVMISQGRKFKSIKDVEAAFVKEGLSSERATELTSFIMQYEGKTGELIRAAKAAIPETIEELTFDTTRLAHLNNEVLNMFSGQGERVTAGKLLADLGQEATEESVDKLSAKLIALRERVAKNALKNLKGDTPEDMILNLFNKLEATRYSNLHSPLTPYMTQAGRTASWVSRVSDKFLYSAQIVAMERKLVMPLARWNLLFMNFGPYNFLENMQRSFLGGGELIYPKSYSGVAETNRLLRGLSNAPYELQMMERGEVKRLAQAIVDPKTGRTAVFKNGKIPFVTRDVTIPEKIPFLGGKNIGKKINIAGQDYYIGSFQDINDMWGEFNSHQVAYDYQVQFLKALAEYAPEEVGAIRAVIEGNRGLLDKVAAISKSDAKDIERVLMQDAIGGGPESLKAHADIDVLTFERRQISKELGKVFDRATEVRMMTKKGIRDEVLDGTIFKDIDGRIAARIESERELSLISLKNQMDVLTKETEGFAANPPANMTEFLGDMENISAMVEGTSERIHDYRKLTELRKAKLDPADMDNFEVGSAKLLAEYMETSEEQLTKIMNQLVENAKGVIPRVVSPESELARYPEAIRSRISKVVSVTSHKDVSIDRNTGVLRLVTTDTDTLSSQIAHELAHTHYSTPGVRDAFKDYMKGRIHPERADELYAEAFEEFVTGKPMTLIPELEAQRAKMPRDLIDDAMNFIKQENLGIKPLERQAILNDNQLARLTDLDSVSRLELENILATRSKIADIESSIVKTPKRSRNDRFWLQQRAQKATIWDEYDVNARKFKSLRLRASRNFLQSVDKPVFTPDFIPEVTGKLTPNHLAYLYGVTGDDLYRGLTRVQNQATIRPREDFILSTREAADNYAAKFNKVADDIGFTEEGIGEVYDQLWRNLGVEPSILTPDSPTVMQLEEIRQSLHRLHAANKIPGRFDWSAVKFGEGVGPKQQEAARILVDELPFSFKTSLKEIRIGKMVVPGNKGEYEFATGVITFRSIEEMTNPKTFYHELGHSIAQSRLAAKDNAFAESFLRLILPKDEVESIMTGGVKLSAKQVEDFSEGFATSFSYYSLNPDALKSDVRKFFNTTFPKGDAPDIVKYRQYINSVAEDIERLPQYRQPAPKVAPIVAKRYKQGDIEWSFGSEEEHRQVVELLNQLPDNVDFKVSGVEINPNITEARNNIPTAFYDEDGTLSIGKVDANLVYHEAGEGALISAISKQDYRFFRSYIGKFVKDEKVSESYLKLIDSKASNREFADLRNRLTRGTAASELFSDDFEKYMTGRLSGEKLSFFASEFPKPKVTVSGAEQVPAGTASWLNKKEQAMSRARELHALAYPIYDDANVIDEGMRAIFPFWNYELFRWRWIPRTWMRTPGTMTGLARYMDYSDQGYIPVPGTDLQLNPLRGSVWMGGLRSMYLKDFPEYYDQMPGMEFFDYIGRAGFFLGTHGMLPIVLFGASQGKPQFSELTPSWMRTGLSAIRAISPEHIGKVLDIIYPDRFRDYMTMLTLAEEGYDADDIWRKKQNKEKLTPEEDKLWLKAEDRVDGIKGILMQQTGLFRIRPQEYTTLRQEMRLAIEESTGVPVAVQEQIDHNFPVTGKRFSDIYKLDIMQQKLLYEFETYRRWQGVGTPLYPAGWQQLEIKTKDYYESVEKIYNDARQVGTFEDGKLVRPSIVEINRQLVAGEIGPDQWKSICSDITGNLAEAVRILGESPAYKDVPKTFEERAKLLEERGIPTPTLGPDQELLYYYYELKPEMKYNWESQRMERDFDTYYAKVDILLESLDAAHRQRLLDRIQSDWTPMEKLYWSASREYLRPYRNLRTIVMNEYSDEERQLIRRYEVAQGTERTALQEVIGEDGDKLIAGFTRRLGDARKRFRILDPTTDAWLSFFGVTTSLLSTPAKLAYEDLRKQYLTERMIK